MPLPTRTMIHRPSFTMPAGEQADDGELTHERLERIHDMLAAEMQRRGMLHRSLLAKTDLRARALTSTYETRDTQAQPAESPSALAGADTSRNAGTNNAEPTPEPAPASDVPGYHFVLKTAETAPNREHGDVGAPAEPVEAAAPDAASGGDPDAQQQTDGQSGCAQQ